MTNSQQPIFILKEGTTRTSGRTAQSNNIAAAKAVAEAVRSTLGPKGMDKMLVDSMGDVVITNDGATILKEMDIEHPAAKMIIEIAKTQEQHCFDGTTTAVVLAGELLKRSEDLIEQNVHPTVICEGFRLASDKAIDLIDSHAIEVNEMTLAEVAKTALTGKSAGAVKEFLSDICVRAVIAVAQEDGDGILVDLDDVKVEKKQGGSIKDSSLVDGIILDKERVHSGMPRVVDNAKIALVNSAIEVKKTEVDAKIQITDPSMLSQFLDEEESYIKGLVDKISASGANVLICQKGIDDLAQHHMAKSGIFAIRRAKKSDMEALSKATGGRIVTTLEDLSKDDLGNASKVDERKIGDSDMVFITGCEKAKAVSVLLRGGTEHVVDEPDADGGTEAATELGPQERNTRKAKAAKANLHHENDGAVEELAAADPDDLRIRRHVRSGRRTLASGQHEPWYVGAQRALLPGLDRLHRTGQRRGGVARIWLWSSSTGGAAASPPTAAPFFACADCRGWLCCVPACPASPNPDTSHHTWCGGAPCGGGAQRNILALQRAGGGRAWRRSQLEEPDN